MSSKRKLKSMEGRRPLVKPSRSSVNDKMAKLLVADFPEDDDEEDCDTSAKVVEAYEDDDEGAPSSRVVKKSSLRIKNVTLLDKLDPRYVGTKMSRKKIFEEEDDDDDDDEDESLESGVELAEDESLDEGSSDPELGSEEEESDEEDVSDMDDDDEAGSAEEDAVGSEDDDDETPRMDTFKSVDKEGEIEKAAAVQNQLRIWDALLEVRIKMQKMLLEVNRLPQGAALRKVVLAASEEADDSELEASRSKATSALQDYVDNLLTLQELLVQKDPEMKKKVGQTSNENLDDDDEEITSSEDDEEEKPKSEPPVAVEVRKLKRKMQLSDYEKEIDSQYKKFIPYRDETIQKWNDKTQLAFGRYKGKNSSSSAQIPVLKQISHILSDKERLLKRTQIKRNSYNVIGRNDTPAEETTSANNRDPEIFDDDDFYHQLLKEVIDRKTSNINDPVQLSRQWLELQKLRTKLKRAVDTKASKGRKIRYDVHPKLVNFMAPRDDSVMGETAYKELLHSLFQQSKG